MTELGFLAFGTLVNGGVRPSTLQSEELFAAAQVLERPLLFAALHTSIS
jgi:hypothetical protein